MSGRITIDNLSDSLKEMIENSGMTEEQVKELLENKEVIDSLKTNSKSIVGAINELFQNANNGKELIASAIGEPLSSEDTFSAMSTDINSLLSTFKTNMMNSGVTVDSGDKFKALIDKIATLADSGNKGVKFASGVYGDTGYIGTSLRVITIDSQLDFTPTHLFIQYTHPSYCTNVIVDVFSETPGTTKAQSNYDLTCTIYETFNPQQFQIKFQTNYAINEITDIRWYAIGVGEGDTTLRDSLANILENKGVDVTEEDDMASLITKVDSIQTGGGLDIISATELPATGRENQICVITDNPEGSFLISTSSQSTNDEGFLVFNDSNSSLSPITITNNGITEQYRISSIKKGTQYLASYVYSNGIWNTLTNTNFVLFDESFKNTNFSGGFNTGTYHVVENSYLRMGVPSVASFKNQIDFTHFNTIIVKSASTGNSSRAPIVIFSGPFNISQNTGSTSGATYQYTIAGAGGSGDVITTTTIDISSWKGLGYLNIAVSHSDYVANMKITYLEIR